MDIVAAGTGISGARGTDQEGETTVATVTTTAASEDGADGSQLAPVRPRGGMLLRTH